MEKNMEKNMCVLSHSVVSNSATPWTVAHQAPQSMEFSRQEYQNGVPFPAPGDLLDPGNYIQYSVIKHNGKE